MAENSKIEWTDHTFNPWVGCQKVSAGCANCYAETQMTRKPRWSNCWGPPELTQRLKTSDSYWKQPLKWNRQAAESEMRPKVFCASLADVFEDNPDLSGWRIELFNLIEQTPNLDWLILTKRPENIRELWPGRFFYMFQLQNIWLGTSIETETQMWRLKYLMHNQDLAAKTFISFEPLLGKIPLSDYWFASPSSIPDWVIVGGESGNNARPFRLLGEWVNRIRIDCQNYDVPFFFKQWGEWMPYYTVQAKHFYSGQGNPEHYVNCSCAVGIDGYGAIKLGKKCAGKTLFGKTYLEFPV